MNVCVTKAWLSRKVIFDRNAPATNQACAKQKSSLHYLAEKLTPKEPICTLYSHFCGSH